MKRTILDLAKPKTTIFDLSNVLNPRVNDDLVKISFHIQYDDKPFNMTGYKMYFISADENMGYINVDGMVDKIEIGDNVGNGDVTFKFPPNVFKKAGTFDPIKTMFVIENINSNYIQSTINISLTVLENGIAKFNADVDQIGYDSKLEEIHNKYKDKAQNLIDELINQVKAVDNFSNVKETAEQAKQVANDSIAKANALNNEVTTARSRFSNLNDRLNNQDIKINAAETTTNANANYNRLTEKDLSQDIVIATKADKIEIESRLNNQDEKISTKADKYELEDKLSKMRLFPEAFENADAIKKTYPEGKPGIFVAIDTGHQWYWINGAWKDGGIYQSAGIDFSNTPTNKIGGYVLPVSIGSIGIIYGSNQTITIDLPSKILYTKVKQNGKISLEGCTTTQSTIDFNNGEYLVFDTFDLIFKNVTQGGLNALGNDYIILGYNSYGVFKGPWINYINSFKDLNYSKNMLIFPSKDLQISVDTSNNATVNFNSKNLFYQNLDSNKLGTYTVVDSEIVVPNNQYLVFDLNQKVLKVLTESQFISDMNSSILCFYNYRGTIFGQWSIYYKSLDNEVPSYYHVDNYIENKIDKINSNSSITSGVNFAYITDTHYGDNAGQSGNLLKYIKENTAISTVVFGGDIVRSYGTKDIALKDVKKYTKLVDDMGVVYGTKGNHDITIRTSAGETTGWTATQSTIYNILNRKNERLIDNGINNKSYYYFDNKIQKVRFIVLDQYEDVQSGETTYWGTKSKFSQEQLDWLINDALNIDGYTLVVFTHSPSDSAMQYYSPYLDVVQKLLVAVNNKQHFTYSQNGLTADIDFSATTNTVACHLSGHAHIDETHVDNGVLSIGVLCDAAYNDDPQYKDKPRTKGTINEQAFDIVSLDTTNRTIKLVRIGQGNDREFNY